MQWLLRTADDLPATWSAPNLPAILSAREALVFERLLTLKRRQDWLLGRLTAKHLIQSVLLEQDQKPALNEITILAGDDGAPQVSFEDDPARPSWTVSISHSKGKALAGTMPGAAQPLGVDIEFIDPHAKEFVLNYFTAAEREMVAAMPEESVDTIVIAIWSAKESALKATRRGLKLDTRFVHCLPRQDGSPVNGWWPFEVRWERDLIPFDVPHLQGYWRQEGAYILSVASQEAPPR